MPRRCPKCGCRTGTDSSFASRTERRERTVVTRIAAVVVLVGLASPPVAGRSNASQEMQDRVQFENLRWTYVRALDTGDAEAYAAAYTPDGQFDSGTPTKGGEPLKKMITDLGQRAAAHR